MPGWLEAFTAHPRIGDVSALRAKFAATAQWCVGSLWRCLCASVLTRPFDRCEGEQSAAMASADEAVLQARPASA